jgi:hypothetical protein
MFAFEARVTAALGGSVTVAGAISPPASVREYDQGDNTATRTYPILLPSTNTGTSSRLPAGFSGTGAPAGVGLLNCQLPGPIVNPPAASHIGVTLTWPHINGATYTVSRTDVGVLTPTPLTSGVYPSTVTFSHSAPMYHHITYQYSIVASYAQGCGRSLVSVAPPPPWVPTTWSSSDAGSGPNARRVTVAWKVPDALLQYDKPAGGNAGFLVLGPGLPAGGQDVWGCTRPPDAGYAWTCYYGVPDWAVTVTVPAGQHTWIVTPYWETDNGRMLDVSSGARVTVTVP